MKIAFVDTYYPPVLENRYALNYKARLADLMGLHFGTSFFYSQAFKQMGWEAIDIVGNDTVGRMLWCKEMGLGYDTNESSVLDELVLFEPDIIYMQDLGFFTPAKIAEVRKNLGCKWVAQHSCPWAGDERVGAFDAVFTSFPHYLPRIAKLGVQTGMLPIAFGAQVLDHLEPVHRDLPLSFVGGLNGTNGHWTRGTEMMERIAEEIPQFRWWGYFIGEGDQYPALKRAYQGPAWGLDMYRIYARSQMVVNRHGEVAEGYANNMRMFEATGCGALLLTERARNLTDYFVPGRECIDYDGTGELIGIIKKRLLWCPHEVEEIAAAGQARTIECHTYERRLAQIEPFLQRMAVAK